MSSKGSKDIVVYWGTPSIEWVRTEPPVSVLKIFLPNKEGSQYPRCPSVREGLKNIFALRATTDFDFEHTRGSLSSSISDTEHFNHMFSLRSEQDRLYSIKYTYMLITEEEDLNLLYTPAYLEDTEFCNNTILVPGILNVGKYFRSTDCAFHLKKGVTGTRIKEGEPYAYINFLTNKNIVLKQFRHTPKLEELHNAVLGIKEHRCPVYKPLSWYYEKVKRAGLKRAVLKEVKDNLCE